MFKKLLLATGILTIIGLVSGAAMLHFGYFIDPARSPYIAQLESPVRGLSPQEVDDLQQGRGAGYARTAELNSYPGPRHVLDMDQELNLSPDQAEQIEVVFGQMQAEAKRLGQEIIRREQELSTAFANQTITEAELKVQTEALGVLYGQLRATHLQAHLQITPLLSTEQIAQYNVLRGYSGEPGQLTSGAHHQHH